MPISNHVEITVFSNLQFRFWDFNAEVGGYVAMDI